MLAIWALAALAVVVQRIAQLALDDPSAGRFRQDAWLLGLWSLATPAIVWSARRFPVRGGSALEHAALHLAAGTAFIVAGNVLSRIPLLSAPYSLGKGRGRIGDLETQLDPALFVRVHRSAIVRVDMIREVQPLTKGDLALVLHDKKVVRVARGRRAALAEVLGKTLGVPLR